MKGSFKIFLLVLVLTLGCVPAFCISATVISVIGKAEMQKNQQWVAIVPGDTIQSGNIISTGFKSEAVLKIGESVINVKALTRLTLEQLVEKDDVITTDVYLDAGRIDADIRATENKRTGFTVRSAVATASVRGTAGSFGADGSLRGDRGVWSYSDHKTGRTTSIGGGQSVALSASATGGIILPVEKAIETVVVQTPQQGQSAAESTSPSGAAPSVSNSLGAPAHTPGTNASQRNATINIIVNTM